MQTERQASDIPVEMIKMINEASDISDEMKRNLLTDLQAKFEHTVYNSRGKEKYVLEDGTELIIRPSGTDRTKRFHPRHP